MCISEHETHTVVKRAVRVFFHGQDVASVCSKRERRRSGLSDKNFIGITLCNDDFFVKGDRDYFSSAGRF